MIRTAHRTTNRWASYAAVLALAACAGDRGPTGPVGAMGPGGPMGTGGPAGTPGASPPIRTALERHEDLPGVALEITGVGGGTRSDSTFQAGDSVSVTFTLKMKNGKNLPLAEMDRVGVLVSGPTVNYQRVLAYQNDVVSAARPNGDGSYTYTFATPLPATSLAPLNDTPTFGAGDGELQGQPLAAGTYTVGMEAYKMYTVAGLSVRDAANATKDFLVGGAAVLEPREVVKIDNCNQCHQRLQMHGGVRRDTKLCVLCHTSGAEDRNEPTVLGGTPGVMLDFRVLIHKLHNAAHLPSVVGVGASADGMARDYAKTPKPFRIVAGSTNRIFDFSEVGFPVFPNLTIAMPRNAGYSSLGAAQRALDDRIRTGVTACEACHGDPDAAGPLAAPAQGDLHRTPSRRACGSCHDDVDWSKSYGVKGGTAMPPQSDDTGCASCHPAAGSALAVADAHLHPLKQPDLNPGVNFVLTNVAEAGTNNGNGRIDPGEKVAITFILKDDAGNDVPALAVDSPSAVVSGPTNNRQMILNTSIPKAALGAGPTYTINLPETVMLERLGQSTDAGGETFTTERTPHWSVTGALTAVLVRTATSGGSSFLTAAALPLQNYVEVDDATGFARNDYIAIDDGVSGSEEYLRIQTVDGKRLWFSSPYTSGYVVALRKPHAASATVREVTLTSKTAGTDYQLNPAAGAITEVTEFGAGNAVLASYTTDFVMPSVYPLALNDSPDLGEAWGKWKGMPIADGTYTVALWGSRSFFVTPARALASDGTGDNTTYRSTSPGSTRDFLVGSATKIVPYQLISSPQNCQSCHKDLMFHGGSRRGFQTCAMCHGTAGAEDRPRYVAPGAPETKGVTINFRTMLHKIHRGADLAEAESYKIVGFGSGTYPNNYGTTSFGEIRFPAMPGGVKNCEACHGTATAWREPAEREHPTGQTLPTRAWRAACGSCHDSEAAQAHIELMTAATGAESCAVCHGAGREYEVPLMHKAR